jgi:hypothetical protein
MKKQFIFRFVDSPMIQEIETREKIAKLLKGYRRNKKTFWLERIETGYRIRAGATVAEIVEAA